MNQEEIDETKKSMYLTSPMTGIPRQRTLFSTQLTYFQPRKFTTEPKILSVLIQLEKERKNVY